MVKSKPCEMDRAWNNLGLSPGASQDDIKQAYRKLVLQYHPDRHASSSKAAQEAAAAHFKVITEAYDLLTDERARSAYYASTSRGSSSSSARGGYSYHHNVNTDWTQSYYNNSSYGGYTSRLSRWEWYSRLARAGVRNFTQTLHLGLAVLLVGGGLLFEYSHTTLWHAKNKGKSFEEMQETIKARQHSKAASGSNTSSTAGTSSSSSRKDGSSTSPGATGHITSAWADGMRGRFVSSESSGVDPAPSGS